MKMTGLSDYLRQKLIRSFLKKDSKIFSKRKNPMKIMMMRILISN